MASYLTRLAETNSIKLQPIAAIQADSLTVASENDNPIRAGAFNAKQIDDAEKLSSDISNQPDNRSKETNEQSSVKQERSNINNINEVNPSIIHHSMQHTSQDNKSASEDVAKIIAAVNEYNVTTSRYDTSRAVSQIPNDANKINQSTTKLINSNVAENYNLKFAPTDTSQINPLLPTSTYSASQISNDANKLINSNVAENYNLKLAPTDTSQINPIIIRENNINFNDNPLLPTSTDSEYVEEYIEKNDVVHNYPEKSVTHIHKQDQTTTWDLNEEVDSVRHSSKQSIQVNVNINHLEMRKLLSTPIVNSRINKQSHAAINKLSLKDYLKRRKMGS